MLQFRLMKKYNKAYHADALFFRLCVMDKTTGEITDYIDKPVDFESITKKELKQALEDALEEISSEIIIDESSLRKHLKLSNKKTKDTAAQLTAKSKEKIDTLLTSEEDEEALEFDPPLINYTLIDELENVSLISPLGRSTLIAAMNYVYELLPLCEKLSAGDTLSTPEFNAMYDIEEELKHSIHKLYNLSGKVDE